MDIGGNNRCWPPIRCVLCSQVTGDANVPAGQVAFVGSAAQMADPLAQEETERIAYRHQLADFEAGMAAADDEFDDGASGVCKPAHRKRVRW